MLYFFIRPTTQILLGWPVVRKRESLTVGLVVPQGAERLERLRRVEADTRTRWIIYFSLCYATERAG